MDDLTTWIHADQNLTELRVLSLIQQADMQNDISQGAGLIDNTWSITIPQRVWEESPILQGHYVYCPGTEWGGPVALVKHQSAAKLITLQGPTWRGLLHQKRIQPPAGAPYFVVDELEANEAIDFVLGGAFGSLFAVSTENTGVYVSASYRYQSMAQGLQNTLRQYGLRLNVVFDNVAGHVLLSAQPAGSLADQVEISQDYGVDFVSSIGNVELANHCLALGSGELAERMVVNVYRTENGYTTTMPSTWTEAQIRTVLLDYPNAETEAELIKSAIERLEAVAQQQGIQVNQITLSVEAQLGDRLAVRDRVTGLEAQAEVTNKILNIAGGRVKVQMNVDTVSLELTE